MNIEVRTRPHQTVPCTEIAIGERIRGVVAETLPDLIASISEVGLLYPVLVDSSYLLIDGEQRLAALAQLGVTDIPVLIDDGATDESGRLRRELASNGVRTQFTPVQAAAARRRLRELSSHSMQAQTGVPLSERRKGWAAELATAETGVSRPTMDRVDKIARIAEDDSLPLHVRREAAVGLTRIDSEGAPVNRVLREVEASAAAASALSRYPELEALPTPAAQANMAAHLDTLPEGARAIARAGVQRLWAHSADVAAAFQLLTDTTRIGAAFEHGTDVLAAARTLASTGALTQELRERWVVVADRLTTLATDLRNTLSEEHT